MKIKLTYDSFNCWTQTKIVTTPDIITEEDIQALFQTELRVPYNESECSYEVVGDGHIYKLSKTLSYTE